MTKRRAKIVLYNPRAVFWTMPLALLAVGSALDRRRCEVVILDGRFDSVERVVAEVGDALCLGVTVLTGEPLGDALAVTRAARVRRPGLPVIWGGWHPSLFPAACVTEAELTAAVTGQGETTFVELVEHLADGAPVADVAGAWVGDGHGGAVGPAPRPLADLNGLPPHDYDLVDVAAYFRAKGRRQLDYVSSQGCRFRCAFCADPAVFGRSWTGLAPARVVAELSELHRRHRFADVGFQDETFFTDRRRVEAIAQGLLDAELGVSWYATLRADQGQRLDDATFALCRRAGLREVVLGVESGHQATLDRIKKDIRLDDVWCTAERLVRHGIGASIGIIVGFPGESHDSVLASLAAARRLRAMSPAFKVSVFAYQPYPGSPIADELASSGGRLPASLEEWSSFTYVDGRSPWLDATQHRLVDGFRAYQRIAFSSDRNPLSWPLRRLARWRVDHHAYGWQLDRRLVEAIRPPADRVSAALTRQARRRGGA
jgi:radical SAM superfamily enzyme YgiQ (UPF0313 family)